MNKRISNKSVNSQQNKLIEQALKTNGFLFPTTVEEVNEFERIYGTTDVILPCELQEPFFLPSTSKKRSGYIVEKIPADNFAMAAREGSTELPKEMKRKIINDIREAQSKRKKEKK
jgi:hypothetical protein